jgi:DNA-binding protein HU-beta
MAKARRTTHRSSKGTKLYAVRSKSGQFKDIQTYKRAHGMDLKRHSKAELAAKAKKAGGKTKTKAKAKPRAKAKKK